MTEFWTHGGKYAPFELNETVAALRKSGQNIIEAEAFTGDPSDSKWNETPEWLKSIGDAAFCAGVNRLVLHRFVQQPWDNQYKPGATIGRWGTHFDSTQTWWEPGKAMVKYWQRSQALLQWSSIAASVVNDFSTTTNDSILVKYIHRHQQNTDVYFVANTARIMGVANCTFKISGMQPELWDPVTATTKKITQFDDKNGFTTIRIPFEKAQSFFIVFRSQKNIIEPAKNDDFPAMKKVVELKGEWLVLFDSKWGDPAKPIVLNRLEDWISNTNRGIKYFSDTAVYKKEFNLSIAQIPDKKSTSYLDLGMVKYIASVKLNGKNLGVVWTAPWQIRIPSGLLKLQNNQLIVEVTNVWANRLIGDEQEPADCEWLNAHIDNGKFLKEFPDWF